jgi:hypothetical protein
MWRLQERAPKLRACELFRHSLPHVSQLAAKIITNTVKVNDHLHVNSLAAPSFDVDGPTESLVPKDQAEIQAARIAVIEGTQELRRLILDPREYLWSKEVPSFPPFKPSSSCRQENSTANSPSVKWSRTSA